MDAETRSVYSAKAEEYEAQPITDAQTKSIAAFLARLPATADILDVGCGPGVHAAEMIGQGHRVTGIDVTPEFVAAAQAKGVNARLGTFDTIDDQAAYDGVWASFSLLHARKSDHPRLIHALATALRPGGVLFIGMKLGDGERRDTLGRFYSYVTEDELRGLVADAGLTPVDVVLDEDRGVDGEMARYILLTAHA